MYYHTDLTTQQGLIGLGMRDKIIYSPHPHPRAPAWVLSGHLDTPEDPGEGSHRPPAPPGGGLRKRFKRDRGAPVATHRDRGASL